MAFTDLINGQTEDFYLDIRLPPSAFTVQQVSATAYPIRFRPLAAAILSLSGGSTNTPVPFTAVKKAAGKKTEVKRLGFKNGIRMMKKAWDLDIISGANPGYRALFLVTPHRYRANPNVLHRTRRKKSCTKSKNAVESAKDDAESDSSSDSSDEEEGEGVPDQDGKAPVPLNKLSY